MTEFGSSQRWSMVLDAPLKPPVPLKIPSSAGHLLSHLPTLYFTSIDAPTKIPRYHEPEPEARSRNTIVNQNPEQNILQNGLHSLRDRNLRHCAHGPLQPSCHHFPLLDRPPLVDVSLPPVDRFHVEFQRHLHQCRLSKNLRLAAQEEGEWNTSNCWAGPREGPMRRGRTREHVTLAAPYCEGRDTREGRRISCPISRSGSP
ncbi:hypothetical protein SODALDRAFT_391039 [Sodiomyces alkalinus F11]|uniref:Uncharacterized protein n=1 Tax=Sodiomyces alkalinus (strain CBS 110278 / VKM F-3762 / F11) TaxID=1314773 RepID=A0A3N2Q5N4_SODAK|nr:hypothetical protein SODALDRAFT_391039 [Sodiomyces alkalinus F11]ROT41968.1 hypothetical protein SODALDRAFT_391039 [Sodiomyces alkalinus F11]